MQGHGVRLWLPQGERPDFGLYLVAGVSSDQHLYLILEGQAFPPPRTQEEDMQRHVPMLALRVYTESGTELAGHGFNNWKGPLPDGDPRQSLIVRLHDEDGSVIWEVQATPVSL
jgi:hypothetical protein